MATTALIRSFKPYEDKPLIEYNAPKRKSLTCPEDNGSFIKPLKQSFIRNARLRPMTRVMLSLLSGWNGAGQGAIKTTTGTIAKHISRSNRMVFNYLQEAMEEGYLSYAKVKDKMGYYIGIKIFLNFGAIRRSFKAKDRVQTKEKTPQIRDRKLDSDINSNININKDKDDKLMATLARFALKAGYLEDTLDKMKQE